MKKNRAIVNLVSEDERYIKAQRRLIQSFHEFGGSYSECDFLRFAGERIVGSPMHHENPYAFKIYAFDFLSNLGYEQILWLDASITFVKNVKPIFDWIDEKGFFMEDSGHSVGQWSNEQTLQYFGITREEANAMAMFSAGFTGIDLTNRTGMEFFQRWKQSMLDGYFHGDSSNHRHDMTCGSIIANQMGISKVYSSVGNYFAYIGDGYGQPNENAVCHIVSI
jgi:hypothetical protein